MFHRFFSLVVGRLPGQTRSMALQLRHPEYYYWWMYPHLLLCFHQSFLRSVFFIGEVVSLVIVSIEATT